jgi:hypothetical protein
MIKPTFFLACALFSFSAMANPPYRSFSTEDGLGDLTKNYYIVSDVLDKTIKKGSFVVQGEVKMFSSGFPLEGAAIGSHQNTTNVVKTGKDGKFVLTCSSKTDSTIYIYSDGWSEIDIRDHVFLDRHRITITAYAHQETNHIKRKPVIYLYTDKDLTASVKINPMGEFTFTYPVYKNGWEVKINAGGMLTDLKSNKNYPYLFWEAESSDLFYTMSGNTIPGFVINTDSTVQFLEEKLALLGLNSTEMTDFITFWGPIIEQKDFALIQFVVDDAYDTQIAGLEITPKPDAIRRVYILCSPIDDSVVGMDVVPQNFTNFERKGFTVVEWGGTEIDLNNLKP